jgi:hypothetical protein
MTDASEDTTALQVARIDWRFLLPDPELGRVVHARGVDPALVAALRAFSAECKTLEDQDPADPLLFDVAVLGPTDGDQLRSAAGRLKPGGWLYIETERRLLVNEARRRERVLRRLGFDAIQRHWHWPDFPSCERIVPLGEPAPTLLVLRQFASSGPAKARLGRLLVAFRLFERAVPAVSVLAQKPHLARTR